MNQNGDSTKEIEEIHQDVLSFTNNVLKLKNPSRLELRTKEEFNKILEEELKKANKKIPDGKVRAFITDNLVIYLNQDALEGETFNEWCAEIDTYFQPYGYFVSQTKLGQHLHELGRLYVDENSYSSIFGIGEWSKEKIENILKPRGYQFERMQTELRNSLKLHDYEKDHEISRMLWEKAHETELNKLYVPKKPEPDEIIMACIEYAALDISKKFNVAFRELESMSIHDIFTKSFVYKELVENPKKTQPRPSPQKLDYLEGCGAKLSSAIGDDKPIGDIKVLLKGIEKELLQLDADGIEDSKNLCTQASALYDFIGSIPPKFRIEEKITNPEGYTLEVQSFVNGLEIFVKRYDINEEK